MASRGENETEILKSNLFSRLDRLIVQLHDCEQLKLVLNQFLAYSIIIFYNKEMIYRLKNMKRQNEIQSNN